MWGPKPYGNKEHCAEDESTPFSPNETKHIENVQSFLYCARSVYNIIHPETNDIFMTQNSPIKIYKILPLYLWIFYTHILM